MFDELGNIKQGTFKDNIKASAAQPITLHYINLEDAGSSRIKLFKICELHGGLVDRVLSPNDSRAKKVMQQSTTARVVSWEQKEELYVFNGRYGEPIGISSSPHATLFEMSNFAPVYDLRAANGSQTNKEVVSEKSWKFKNDENIDIQRFLQGMGETELEDPETMPDKPEDAAKFLAHSNLPQLPQGRPRIPKVMPSSSSNDDSDSDTEDDSQSFNSVSSNRRNVVPPQLDASLIFGASVSAAQTIHVNRAAGADDLRTPTLRNPFPVPLTAHVSAPAVAANGHDLLVVPSQASESSQAPLLDQVTAGPPQTGDLPVYDRSYVNVDRIGLGGNAANQAAWEHKNPLPRKKTTTKSGITRRPAITSSDCQSPVLVANTGADDRNRGPSLQSSAASTSSLSLASPSAPFNNNIPTGSENWANNVVRPTTSGPKLVDDTIASTNVISHGKEADHFAGLIAASRNKTAGTSNAGPRGAKPQSSTDRDNFIIERLQVVPDISRDRKYTMNQKAGKPRNKKPQRKPTASKVVLPMPDPVPAVQNPATKNGTAAKKSSSSQATMKPLTLIDLRERYASSPSPDRSPSRSRSTSPHHREASVQESEKGITAVEQLLRAIPAISSLEGAQLVVSFGMILSSQQGSKEALPKGAVLKEILQIKLRAGVGSCETTFLTRLSTSTNDAMFMLSDIFVPGSPVSAKCQYELVIKNPDGSLSTIIMDHADRSDLQMVADSDVRGTIYVHYPIRIWDAKVTIERAVLDSPAQAVIDFVSSMQTVDEPPSFLAMIPTAAFGIEKVYAKRMFSKTVQDGLELFVTEAQELALESRDDATYNVKVAAFSKERMENEQRLWWECGLRSDVVDPERARELQCVIDRMVTKMDGVGYGTKGPWTKAEVTDGQGVVEQWFW